MELLKIWMSGFILIILRKLNIIFNIRAVLIIFFVKYVSQNHHNYNNQRLKLLQSVCIEFI